MVIIMPLVLTNCKWLRNKGIIGKKAAMKEYIQKLEDIIKDDSLQIAQMKKESQAKIDSLKNNCKEANNAYYVITGSFRNSKYAEDFLSKMKSMGYKSEIVEASNGFNLVSAFSGNNYKEVLNALYNLRNSVDQESWLYVKN
jgi:cell division protein FtsN